MTPAAPPAELTTACPEVRPATPADAVAGVAPRYVAAPATEAEASALLTAAAGLGLAVLPRGGGTRLAWGAAPARCDLVVDTWQLNAVLEHSAGDQVVRAQAGVPLAALARVLAEAGQRLAVDPADAGGTVGGLLATGVAGPLRLRYGTPRDLLIGVTMVRADGAVARAGGKVVKNVAGYDTGKLLAGSYGTLGLITDATFRVHPAPAAASYVSLDCDDPEAAAAALLGAASSTLVPSAAELDWPARGAPVSVAVLFEGDPAGVAQRAARLRDVLAKTAGAQPGAIDDAPPPWWGRGAVAAPDATVLRIAFWAGRLAGVLGAIRDAAVPAGLDPAVSGSGAAGVLHAAVPPDAPPAAVARFVAGLRAALPAGRSSAVVLHAPAQVAAAVDLWGPVPSAGLMQSVKDQFDPEHRMAPGRFAGGI
ncbi:MAG TPA: FAD-binding oxidoreductase [Streptosporangiaceae bacterium]|jgi:glycolate oxidase FAD binding subunit